MTTALIVEDNTVVRGIIVEILKDLEVSPVERQTAEEGVEYCADAIPDIVLLDWDLPNLGALEFLRGVGCLPEEQRPTILLCATENDDKQFTLAKAAGAKYNILKPFDKPLLAAKLSEIGVLEGESDTGSEVEPLQVAK